MGYTSVRVFKGTHPDLKKILVYFGHYDYIVCEKPINGDIIANESNNDACGIIAPTSINRILHHQNIYT